MSKAPEKKSVIKATSLLEKFDRHFGNKHKFNEEEEEVKKDGEEEVTEEEELDAEGNPIKKEGEADEDIDAAGDTGKGVIGVIESLIADDNSSDMEKQKGMCDKLSQVAESEEPQSNAFMEALDDAMSSMELQAKDPTNEDQDAEYLYVFQPEKFKAMGEARKKISEAKKKDKKKAPVKKK